MKKDCTIRATKTKALISFAVTFVFAYADCWFSHAAAHLICFLLLISTQVQKLYGLYKTAIVIHFNKFSLC